MTPGSGDIAARTGRPATVARWGLLGDSGREIRACIDALEAARAIDEPEARAAAAREVLPRIERLRRGRRIARSVREAVEAGDLERAVAILELHRRSARLGFLRVVPWLLVPALAAIAVVATGDRGASQAALEVTAACPAATELLGDEPGRSVWSRGCGATTTQGDQGVANWSLPVSGEQGSGRLGFTAQRSGGAWRVVRATLEADGRWIGVEPCLGELSEPDARGVITEEPAASGLVRRVEGEAPVEVGDRCGVTVTRVDRYPDRISWNCQVRVRCAGDAIYGDQESNGYVFCAVRDGRPVQAKDVGGTAASSDPMLDLDLPGGRVVVSDDEPTRYAFTIELD